MSFNIHEEDRILIVAPHPDDETIGCGGLMLRYGSQCEILILTDGRKGYDSKLDIDENMLVKQRISELQSAVNMAGVRIVHSLGIRDGTVLDSVNIIYNFDITPYTYIFVPNHLERHKDHAPVLKIFEKMRTNQRANVKIYEYEVWSPIPSPTDYIDISESIDSKLEMVRQYQSQIKFLDYDRLTEGLNRYRGASQKTEYAEMYAYVPYFSIPKRIYHRLPVQIRKRIRKLLRNNMT